LQVALLAGTRNWITVATVGGSKQWPAEIKQLFSRQIAPVQVTGMTRPTQSSLDGTRSSAPHRVANDSSPASPWCSRRSMINRFVVRGPAISSTVTVSPLK